MRDVTVVDQLGTLTLDVVKPDRLLVPTATSVSGPPAPLATPIDHYQCYRGAGRALSRERPMTTTLFGGPLALDIERPFHLCAPVDENGEGIVDPTGYLTCYRVRARAQSPQAVFTDEQFGPDRYDVYGIRELCVPSVRQP